jgi:imidazolonepropionase
VLGRLGELPGGAVLVRGGLIEAVGASVHLLAQHPEAAQLDASGCVVMPGFVDPHTHLVWAGDRAGEFELRREGKTYLEILAAGGGILSTVRATRQAAFADLLGQTRHRARSIFAHGTTTAEAKTGYGLETSAELRQMEVLLKLDEEGPLEIAPTFLGAHAVPVEFEGDTGSYTRLVCAEMLPDLRDWWEQRAPGRPLPFVDVFCDRGAFNLEQSRQVLSHARELGFPLKIHADEFENLGGVRLACELGAISADHLVKTSPEEIGLLGHARTARSPIAAINAAAIVAAVSLPCTPFGLSEGQYTPAKQILASGGILALASDLNPGTAWCGNMQFVIALACRSLGLTVAQAVAAATINAAAALGLEQRLGSLEPGKQADLLVLSVADYRHLGYRFGANLVRCVIKKGKVYPIPQAEEFAHADD